MERIKVGLRVRFRRGLAPIHEGQTKPRSCPLVLVEWTDSRQPIPGWCRLTIWKMDNREMCVGWVASLPQPKSNRARHHHGHRLRAARRRLTPWLGRAGHHPIKPQESAAPCTDVANSFSPSPVRGGTIERPPVRSAAMVRWRRPASSARYGGRRNRTDTAPAGTRDRSGGGVRASRARGSEKRSGNALETEVYAGVQA